MLWFFFFGAKGFCPRRCPRNGNFIHPGAVSDGLIDWAEVGWGKDDRHYIEYGVRVLLWSMYVVCVYVLFLLLRIFFFGREYVKVGHDGVC